MGEPITDANLKDIVLQNFLGTLKMQKNLVIQQRTDTEDLKESIKDVKDKVVEHIDTLLPSTLMTNLRNKLKKDDALSKEVEALYTWVATIEGTLSTILANQAAQTALLQQLLQAPASIQTLDDNKKGEKNVGTSHQHVESSRGIEATTEGGHVVHMPTSEGEPQEDTIANRLANSNGVSTNVILVHTTVLRVLTPTLVCHEVRKSGEPSSKSEFKPIMVDVQSPVKEKGKNIQREAKLYFHGPFQMKRNF